MFGYKLCRQRDLLIIIALAGEKIRLQSLEKKFAWTRFWRLIEEGGGVLWVMGTILIGSPKKNSRAEETGYQRVHYFSVTTSLLLNIKFVAELFSQPRITCRCENFWFSWWRHRASVFRKVCMAYVVASWGPFEDIIQFVGRICSFEQANFLVSI